MVWFLIATVGPVLVFALFCNFSAVVGFFELVWNRVHGREPRPAGPPLERVAADLHRLADNLHQVELGQEPAKMARLRAASLAYDGVLLEACRSLEVPAPQGPPLEPLERL